MMTEESKQFFCWGRSCGRKRYVREIYVSCVGDTVHAGDKALTRETSAQRGRVNRYAQYVKVKSINSSISRMPLSRICYSPDSPVHGDHQSIYPSHGDSIPLFQQGSPSLVESSGGIPTSPYSPVYFVPQMFD